MKTLVRCAIRAAGWTMALWLAAVLIGAVVLWQGAGSAFSTDIERRDGSDSARAAALLREQFPNHAERLSRPNEIVVVHSASLTVDDPAYAEHMQRISERLQSVGSDVIRGARSWFIDGDERLISADRRSTLVPLVVHDAQRHVAALRSALADATRGTPLQATLIGQASVGLDYRQLAEADLHAELTIGLPAAAVVLLWVFGSPIAALLPLLVAGAAMVVALAVVVLAGQVVPVYFLVTNMVVMMCMAVGIDVALFMLARWREERAAGHAPPAAALRSASSAGRAIVWSGATVALALLGLLLVPTNVFQGLALGAIVAVLTAVLAALSLLPAMLTVLGPRVDLGAWRRPGVDTRRRLDPGMDSGLPSTWPLAVRRPWLCAAAAIGVLVALAIPAAGLKIGFAGIETLPSSVAARQAFDRLQQSFRIGGLAEAQIIIALPAAVGDIAPAVDAAIVRLRQQLAGDAAFVAADLAVRSSPGGGLRVISIPMPGDAEDPAAQAAIERLRAQWIPQAFSAVADRVEVRVGGLAAGYLDFFALIRSHAPWVMAAVLASSFGLLAVAFRSWIVPLKAIVLNLLSVSAAYGALVLVFQHGFGASWLGLQSGVVVEAWIPLFLFTVLYGLSMDYHVFLLSRMRESFDATGDNSLAVITGLRSTARVIGGAALIMVAVFAGLAAGELVMFQQMGFGLAVALLLDATLIRLWLVPALMTLLGERNWHAPAWLRAGVTRH